MSEVIGFLIVLTWPFLVALAIWQRSEIRKANRVADTMTQWSDCWQDVAIERSAEIRKLIDERNAAQRQAAESRAKFDALMERYKYNVCQCLDAGLHHLVMRRER